MNTSAKLLTAALAIAASVSVPRIAVAQNCNYYAGQASNGKPINVDLCSTQRVSDRSLDFVYFLGSEKIYSQANCQAGTWTTFPEKTVSRPQSQATQTMLNAVCQNRGQNQTRATQAFIVDPPSNVRDSPNGRILCSLNSRTAINTYGAKGNWYYTDACGQMGMIHSSQIRF